MTKDEAYGPYMTRKCPICGKNFIPAPYHVYRAGKYKTNKLLCSYTCMLAHERKQEERLQELRRKAKERRQQKRESENTVSAIEGATEGA